MSGEAGGDWYVTRNDDQWIRTRENEKEVTAGVTIDPDTAWKLFSKSLRPEHVRNKVKITGNQKLGEVALGMVSVMA